MQHCVALPDISDPVPTFYMHEHSAINMAWLRHCDGFAALRESSAAENTAEVGLHHVLHNHPARVTDPSRASLVYVPVWEFVSRSIGTCRNTTHGERMRAAHNALRATGLWRESCHASGNVSCGASHLWLTTAYSAQRYTLSRSMFPLSNLLGGSIVGRYKSGGLTRASKVGQCAIEMPYQAPLAATRLAASLARLPDEARPQRTRLLFFAGALDVCCTGAAIRCAIGALFVATFGVDPDVLVRPTGNGACTRRALEGAANKTRSAGGDASAVPAYVANASRAVATGVVNQTAHEMATSTFCLVPAGDTCVTSRLFASMALGCIPVVLCDGLTGALPEHARYSSWWIKHSTRTFMRDATAVLRELRALPAADVARRQREMRDHVADALYDGKGSRVGTNFLIASRRHAMGCAVNLTGSYEDAVSPSAARREVPRDTDAGADAGGGSASGGGAPAIIPCEVGRHAG